MTRGDILSDRFQLRREAYRAFSVHGIEMVNPGFLYNAHNGRSDGNKFVTLSYTT